MPSFSSFLKNSGSASKQEDRSDSDVGVKVDSSSSEKLQRRISKRDFFRGLLKRSSLPSDTRRNGRRSAQMTAADLQASPTNSFSQPATPMSPPMSPMSDPNKPLPPPPAVHAAEDKPAKAPLKLARIISPISTPDLHKLFSGAPQFFARSEGHHTGAPHPLVAFPWDIGVDIRDLSDHLQIDDAAWGSVTAWPHVTRDVSRNPEAVKEHHEKTRAHYVPRCRERPNMLSMQGIERGTIGYQAALEMGVADVLNEGDEEFSDGSSLADRRREFINSKDGLRPFSESTLIDRLTSVSTTYHEDPFKHSRPTVELYTELFTQILYPPSRVTDAENPYSLLVQIEVLLRVLRSPGVWIDFSLVEWRIRLGQILWGPPPEHEPEDRISIDGEEVEPNAQKFWLLLQILLSCELAIRLDAVCQDIDQGLEVLKPAELHHFDRMATEKVKWSLILARQWLENIRIERTRADTVAEKKVSAGWFSTLTGAASTGESTGENAVIDSMDSFQFRGRYQERQLSGLLHFARKLEWPQIGTLAAKISSSGIGISDSVQDSLVDGTPLSMTSQRSSSYFPSQRPTIRRGISRPQKISTLTHPSGWLSNSYLSGLMLPGEGMSHLLISTLLENDDEAVARLGEDANLYGGFIYFDKSFWSTSCIVGRVLAAGKGARECMGWISSDIPPRGAGEGWVNIDVDTTLQPMTDTSSNNETPRIWKKSDIEHDGHIIGGTDASSVLLGDFTIPSDKISSKSISVTLESLDLFAAVDSVHTTPTREVPTPFSEVDETPQIHTYSAMMRFSVESETKKELNVALTHDILFVTAHPCLASHHVGMLNSPTSPGFHSQNDGSSSLGSGHALHKAFTYSQIPLSTLLASPSQSLASFLSPSRSPSRNTPSPGSSFSSGTIPKVLVINCISPISPPLHHIASQHISVPEHKHQFGSDREILVRALCAEKGWNALISRRGRGCIACAVREMNALGWAESGVVLRF